MAEKKEHWFEKHFLGVPRYAWPFLFVGLSITLYGLVCRNVDSTEYITVGLAIAGGTLLLWRSISFERQVKVQEAGLVVQRWKDSMQLLDNKGTTKSLNNENPAVLLGGVKSLRQMAKDNSKDYAKVAIKVFFNFIRTRLADLAKKKNPGKKKRLFPDEIDEAIKGVKELANILDYEKPIYLYDCDFSNFKIPVLPNKTYNFSGLHFIDCNFTNMEINNCDFTGAKGSGKCNFNGAIFERTNLTCADFSKAKGLKTKQLDEAFYTDTPDNCKKENGKPELPGDVNLSTDKLKPLEKVIDEGLPLNEELYKKQIEDLEKPKK